MAQACIYLEDPLMCELKAEAERKGVSLSRLIASVLKERKTESVWPEGFWDCYGAFADDEFERPAELDWALDAPRELF